ncbi:UNVERIFIED_CONTAM: hypothetical protein GTU68_026906 [Idotea baltica]|nr:hypothetical protein [Idotea baltica]
MKCSDPQAYAAGVTKLLQLAAPCIYPSWRAAEARTRFVTAPGAHQRTLMRLQDCRIKLCESYNRQYGTDYRSVMPTNLYGPGDNFHPENSHVLPALILRFHKAVQEGAKEVVIWGSGKPMREFLHVDDMAAASLFRETQPMLSHINVGSGTDVTIRELAETVARVTGFTGQLVFDTSKPDGTPRKLMDVSRLERLGWTASIALEQGIAGTYEWFLSQNTDDLRAK